ncbi:hypothetical protein DIPPA_00956 [Diplonema papillatum]|nr:hypothetical protein DIPPA_00956 [Diplonema papillatum]
MRAARAYLRRASVQAAQVAKESDAISKSVLLSAEGKLADARDLLQGLRRDSQEWVSQGARNLAAVQLRLGELSAAEDVVRSVVGKEPTEQGKALNAAMLGTILHHQERFKEADPHLEIAANSASTHLLDDPATPALPLLVTHALNLQQLNRHESATRALSAALPLAHSTVSDPEAPFPVPSRAQVLSLLRTSLFALERYEDCLTVDEERAKLAAEMDPSALPAVVFDKVGALACLGRAADALEVMGASIPPALREQQAGYRWFEKCLRTSLERRGSGRGCEAGDDAKTMASHVRAANALNEIGGNVFDDLNLADDPAAGVVLGRRQQQDQPESTSAQPASDGLLRDGSSSRSSSAQKEAALPSAGAASPPGPAGVGFPELFGGVVEDADDADSDEEPMPASPPAAPPSAAPGGGLKFPFEPKASVQAAKQEDSNDMVSIRRSDLVALRMQVSALQNLLDKVGVL